MNMQRCSHGAVRRHERILAREERRLTQTPYNNRTVAGVADPGRAARLQICRGQRRAVTSAQIFVGSVVFGQKTEFLHNLLPIFMEYVSEQSETASRDS